MYPSFNLHPINTAPDVSKSKKLFLHQAMKREQELVQENADLVSQISSLWCDLSNCKRDLANSSSILLRMDHELKLKDNLINVLQFQIREANIREKEANDKLNLILDVLQKDQKPEQCNICMDNPKSTVFVPCGHRSCLECARSLTSSKCPFCRSEIKDVIKTYDN